MEEHRCSECGKEFSSNDTLEKHLKQEHNSVNTEDDKEERDLKPNREQVVGAMLGFLLAALLITGFNYFQDADFETKDKLPDIKERINSQYDDLTEPTVDITVVTCDNCSYSEFQDTTGGLMKTEYREVDYQSEEGQRLIERYELNYIPGFIFDKNVERAENFTRIESVVVEFDDAYVLPDKGVEAAQRESKGIDINR